MRNNITNRDNFFLGKVAGRDIDISTLTPPVPTSMREKLLLEIADRLDNGGGAPTLEVVAEIEVGQMTEQVPGLFSFEPNEGVALPEDKQLYFNSVDYPLTWYAETGWGYNIDLSSGTPTWEEPAYAIIKSESIVISSQNLSNTTVKILAEAVSNNDNVVIFNFTGDYIDDINGSSLSFYKIIEYLDAGKTLVGRYERNGVMTDFRFVTYDGSRVYFESNNTDGDFYLVKISSADVITERHPFPMEGASNANKLIGFDSSGNYEAIDSPIFKVTYTFTESEGTISASYDVSYSGIINAISAGRTIVAKIAGDLTAQTNTYIADAIEGQIVFSIPVPDGNDNTKCYAVIHKSDNTIIPVIPA